MRGVPKVLHPLSRCHPCSCSQLLLLLLFSPPPNSLSVPVTRTQEFSFRGTPHGPGTSKCFIGMPRVLEPVTAVKTAEVEITEYAGNASSGQPGISIASVVAQGGWAEPWQTPEFDEWVIVNKGKV